MAISRELLSHIHVAEAAGNTGAVIFYHKMRADLRQAVQSGVAIELPPVIDITPLLDLQAVRQRQIGRQIARGFHTELNMVEDEYRESFPVLSPQPEGYNGRFDIPLVVEPRIRLRRQLELANLRSSRIVPEHVRNINEIPNTPYAIWTHIGREYEGATDEVASPLVEGIALFLQYPEIWRYKHELLAIGSSYSNLLTPMITDKPVDSDWSKPVGPNPVIDYGWFEPGRQAISRGKQIIVGRK